MGSVRFGRQSEIRQGELANRWVIRGVGVAVAIASLVIIATTARDAAGQVVTTPKAVATPSQTPSQATATPLPLTASTTVPTVLMTASATTPSSPTNTPSSTSTPAPSAATQPRATIATTTSDQAAPMLPARIEIGPGLRQAIPATYGSTRSGSVSARAIASGTYTFSRIVGGYGHACGLTTTGAAYCWGYNYEGQLGDGTFTDRFAPVAVSGALTFAALVSGQHHMCGLTAANDAYCWGQNGYGQLGNGTNGSGNAWFVATPTAVGGSLKFSTLTAGDAHTCGLTTTGAAYCWGSNANGQLGDSTGTDRALPVAVSTNRVFTSIVAGFQHTCATVQSGPAWCWGSNASGQLGDGTSGANRNAPQVVSGGYAFERLAAGSSHTCGLVAMVAYCWGGAWQGQLGSPMPVNQVPYITVPTAVTGQQAYVEIVAGQAHTCALSGSRAAFCWGANENGQVGDGSTTDRFAATAVGGGQSFTSVATGGQFTCGVNTAGIAYCWGSNWSGQLGTGASSVQPTPAAVTGGKLFTSIATGMNHTCGLTAEGAAYCWGWNRYGQLGDGSTVNAAQPVPVTGGLTFASLVAGDVHTCGLTKAGSAYCWGSSGGGSIGDGQWLGTRVVPVAVSGQQTFASLTAGGNHTCGLTTSGLAYCWGYNSKGQLGNGDTTSQLSPAAVAGGRTFAGITGGSFHTCALTSAGATYCWGSNEHGQLGDGTTTNRSDPVAATGTFTFAKLVADWGNTCGLTSSGTAYCWGNNWWGQLGDGKSSFNGRPMVATSPLAVSGGRAFTAFGLGSYAACGVTAPGTTYCWGALTSGNTNVPTAFDSTLSFSSVDGGNSHMCAISPGGPTSCWGRTNFGQLGNGMFGYQANPARVIGQAEATPTVTPTPSTAIRSVRVANVRDTSFAVSWVSDVATTGSIAWRPDGSTASPTFAMDIRGAAASSTMHLVTVSGVAPSSSYRFDIYSGAAVDTNAGAHYLVTTGPTADATAPDQAYGTVALRDGGAPNGVLVHLVASGPSGTSAPLVDLVTASDQRYWGINLGNLRTASLASSFAITDETILTVSADGGADGTAIGTTTAATARLGTFALTLSDEVTASLGAGWNLIALRASPTATLSATGVCTSINTGGSSVAVEIDRWIDGGWEGHRCNLPPNDFALQTSVGYFVRLSAPATWTYRGSLVTSAPTLSLTTGWNLVGAGVAIGAPSTAAGACTIMNAAQAGTAVELDRWVDGGWEGHRCGLPPNDFTLQAGQGYFVRLTRPASWAPSGAAPVSASSHRP